MAYICVADGIALCISLRTVAVFDRDALLLIKRNVEK
jgi:hypothetical protein